MNEDMMQNIEQRIALVRNDREHGSRWLVRESILILRDLARMQMTAQDEQMRALYAAGRELAQARPAMAALTSAMGRILRESHAAAEVAEEAEHLLKEYDAATGQIATHAKSLLQGNVMTCSLSGTVLEVLAACRSQIENVTVLEGRPRYEGREMARALSEHGLGVTLITDAQADIFLPQCHAVVLGADSILANGDVLNKAGTALLAWSAYGHSVPFYVLCETLKISPHRWSEEQLSDNLALLEEKEAQEVLEQPLPGVTVRNFYFDHTPHKLVGKIVTERGVLDLQAIEAIAAEAKANEEHLARRL